MKYSVLILLFVGISLSPAWAQQDDHTSAVLPASNGATLELPFSYDGPAPP